MTSIHRAPPLACIYEYLDVMESHVSANTHDSCPWNIIRARTNFHYDVTSCPISSNKYRSQMSLVASSILHIQILNYSQHCRHNILDLWQTPDRDHCCVSTVGRCPCFEGFQYISGTGLEEANFHCCGHTVDQMFLGKFSFWKFRDVAGGSPRKFTVILELEQLAAIPVHSNRSQNPRGRPK